MLPLEGLCWGVLWNQGEREERPSLSQRVEGSCFGVGLRPSMRQRWGGLFMRVSRRGGERMDVPRKPPFAGLASLATFSLAHLACVERVADMHLPKQKSSWLLMVPERWHVSTLKTASRSSSRVGEEVSEARSSLLTFMAMLYFLILSLKRGSDMSAKNMRQSSTALSRDCFDFEVVLKHLLICSSPNTLIMKYPNSLNITSVPF